MTLLGPNDFGMQSAATNDPDISGKLTLYSHDNEAFLGDFRENAAKPKYLGPKETADLILSAPTHL